MGGERSTCGPGRSSFNLRTRFILTSQTMQRVLQSDPPPTRPLLFSTPSTLPPSALYGSSPPAKSGFLRPASTLLHSGFYDLMQLVTPSRLAGPTTLQDQRLGSVVGRRFEENDAKRQGPLRGESGRPTEAPTVQPARKRVVDKRLISRPTDFR